MKNYFYIISLLVFSNFISSCSVNPVSGKKQLSFMSESQEIAIGKESDPAVIAQFGLYPNDTLQKFIKEKGLLMAAKSHRPGLPFEFRVLDSDVINAFAVPGGYVYFTRGILAHFNNEAQFAGVLGHEIGHITARAFFTTIH
jgi:predicted Zn-dependent protease